MTDCLISAGRWLVGLDATGEPEWRHDATIRVDQGMVAQVGAFEAVAYGNDQLPRYGDVGAVALPIFAPADPHSLASRLGGARGRLTPGSPAQVVLFRPGAASPSRRALRAAAFGEADDGAIFQVFLDGRLVIDGGAIVADASALRATLDSEETPEEAALWAAARCSRGR